MKNAPFSITPILFAVLIVSAIIGAFVALLVGGFGISGWLGFFLAAFVPVPVAGIVRSITAAALGSAEGVEGPVPTASTLVVRLGIGAAIAAVVAFLINQFGGALAFGALSGAMAALATSMIATVTFTIMMFKR